MSKQTVKTRVQNKHDIEANWDLAENFVPLVGEVIVYDADENYNYQRMKIGDGVTSVKNLPFFSTSVQIVSWEAND